MLQQITKQQLIAHLRRCEALHLLPTLNNVGAIVTKKGLTISKRTDTQDKRRNLFIIEGGKMI